MGKKSHPIMRILSKVKLSDNGCLIFSGTKSRAGYGVIGVGEKTQYTHRYFYEYFIGKIPKEMKLCHKCDNPPCLNPKHLFLGTQKDNMADAKKKGRTRGAKGETSGKARLSTLQVIQIRESKLSNQRLAIIHGVSKTHIGHIKNNKRWGWLKG